MSARAACESQLNKEGGMSVSRIVTLLTPVFAGLAGWLCQLAAKYLPGTPQLDSTELTAVFIAGALAAAAAVQKWLDGRGKYDAVVVSQVGPK